MMGEPGAMMDAADVTEGRGMFVMEAEMLMRTVSVTKDEAGISIKGSGIIPLTITIFCSG